MSAFAIEPRVKDSLEAVPRLARRKEVSTAVLQDARGGGKRLVNYAVRLFSLRRALPLIPPRPERRLYTGASQSVARTP
jgi:hypothetical protein